MTRSILQFSAAALLMMLAGCSDRPLTGDPSAVPGELVVQLRAATTPAGTLGAIRFTVRGGDIAQVIAGDSSFTVFTNTTADGISVVVIGPALRGSLVRLRVPDVRKVADYRAVIAEAVDRDNRPVSLEASYGLEVAAEAGAR